MFGLLVVKRGLCWRRRTLWGRGNLILESCRRVREEIMFSFRQCGSNQSYSKAAVIKSSVASFRTARFEDGSWKSGRGIWLFVWRVFKPELTNIEAVQRETRWPQRHRQETVWRLTWNCLMAGLRHLLAAITWTFMIWMEWARARWRAPISRSDRQKAGDILTFKALCSSTLKSVFTPVYRRPAANDY